MFSRFQKDGGPKGQKPAVTQDWLSEAHGTDDAERAAAQIAEHQRRSAEAAKARAKTEDFMEGVRARVTARGHVAAHPDKVAAHPTISPKNTR